MYASNYPGAVVRYSSGLRCIGDLLVQFSMERKGLTLCKYAKVKGYMLYQECSSIHVLQRAAVAQHLLSKASLSCLQGGTDTRWRSL